MIKKLLCIGTILLVYSLICHNIYIKNEKITKKIISPTSTPQKLEDKEQIGYIKIEKLNLFQPLYKKESKHNNIEENITILEESIMPNEENSILFLAAHSGTGEIAYFQNLDKLKPKDIIKLKYKKNIYYYQVKNIWEEKKTGYIHVNKNEKKQLILTTCNPRNSSTQLSINCILINEKTTNQS